jgi:hypothetical protein
MTGKEKAELLKPTITHLYSNEGRSKSYISRLLGINRKSLTEKIAQWNLKEAEPRRHMNPSTKKFLNANRNYIKSRLDINVSISKIAKELGVPRKFLQYTIIPNDEVLNKARNDYMRRMKANHDALVERMKEKSSYEYNIEDLPGEEWKDIPGYKGQQISNMGRVRHYALRYKAYHLLTPQPNARNGRMYVSLRRDDGKVKNLQVSRLVGHAFVPGYDKEHNTINHEDGNVQNNKWTNLKWMSQGDNNRHAHEVLGYSVVRKRKYHFKKIVYKDQYEFKTITAFAKFLGKSPTQTRRYLDEPEKHDIKLIK